jgi:hypothetical protein
MRILMLNSSPKAATTDSDCLRAGKAGAVAEATLPFRVRSLVISVRWNDSTRSRQFDKRTLCQVQTTPEV